MQLLLQDFATLVQNMAAVVQSTSTRLLDLAVGSTVRAILEANASVALWMQWLILQVLQATRAATSSGADLDSWMADMTLTRLPAVAATGLVSLSRFSPGIAALVPIGALVRTADGSQTFSVTLDPTNGAWNSSQNGYVVAAGQSSIVVPVIAEATGSAGNVQAGAITLLATAIPGIDLVTNAVGFLNGLDPETDAAFRARFQNFIGSRSRATRLAVEYAISSAQQGLSYTVQENVDAAGGARQGSFIVTIDDGSGAPSATLLTIVGTAIDAVRPIGSIFTVLAPTVLTANVTASIEVSASANKSQSIALVVTAITSYINGLPVGAPLPLTKLAQIAYAASPTVVNVGGLVINGAMLDIAPSPTEVIKSGQVVVS